MHPHIMDNRQRRSAIGWPDGAARGAGLHAMLHSLTYVSLATQADPDLLERQAHEIAAASSVRNRQDGLTGALAVGGGWFAQVLEGPAGILLATFDRLLRDRRHTDIRVIEFVPTVTRGFAGWSMACSGKMPPGLIAEAAAAYAAREAAGLCSTAVHGQSLCRAMLARIAPAEESLASLRVRVG
ncbi:BLUF domain-containing protein [Roseococcus suduntuyensis]|nr:BLUF domain-containing protein [Roseococcus suduntuyensis]